MAHQEPEATGVVCQSTCKVNIGKSPILQEDGGTPIALPTLSKRPRALPMAASRSWPSLPLTRFIEMSQKHLSLDSPLTTVAHSPLLGNPI